jgi:hypothetical protein
VKPQELLEWIGRAELGATKTRLALDRRAEFRDSAARLASQARHELLIFTHDLDPPVYDQQAFLDALKELVLTSQNAHVWVLLQSNQRVQREGHRLVELSRRLPSSIEIRRVHEDYADHPAAFLVADETGYLYQHHFTRHEGTVCFHGPLEARQHRSFFLEVWDQSVQDPELRRLHL